MQNLVFFLLKYSCSSSFPVLCRTRLYCLYPECHSQLTQTVDRRRDFSWCSVPLLWPLCSPDPHRLPQSAAYSSESLFWSWCLFRCVTSRCNPAGVCSHGLVMMMSFGNLIYLYFAFVFVCVCQAVVSHRHVDFVCRYFSRRFSCTYLRRPPALMSTNGWSSKPSREYAQVCVHFNQLSS